MNTLIGRSSSHYTRLARMFALEAGVPFQFQPVFDALKRAGYDGWMTVEAFGSPLPGLAAATKVWRPLFRDQMDVAEGGYRLMRDGWDRAK